MLFGYALILCCAPIWLHALMDPNRGNPDVASLIKGGEGFRARLVNSNTREHLYPTVQDFSEDKRRRRVLTRMLKEDAERDEDMPRINAADWIIEPVEGTENCVRFNSGAFPGEYLLAGTDDLSLDANRRKVFTWKETGTDFSGWEKPEQWCLIPVGDPADNRFRVRNMKFQEDLFAAGESFVLDSHLGNVFTCRRDCAKETDGDDRIWEVILV